MTVAARGNLSLDSLSEFRDKVVANRTQPPFAD